MMQALKAASNKYIADATAGRPETLKSRARVFECLYDTLTTMDSRVIELQSTSILPQIGTTLLRRISSPLAEAPVDDVMWGAMWMRDSAPTFILTAGVAANLILTDPGKLLEDDVAWPFPAFRIVLPSPECEVFFTRTDRSTLTRMRSINVLDWVGRDGASPMESIDISGLHYAFNSESFAVELTKVIDKALALVASRPSERTIMTRGYADGELSIFANQRWRGDKPVSDWMAIADADIGNVALKTTDELVDRDRIAMRVAQRIAVNLALYLGTAQEESGEPLWTKAMRGQGPYKKNWTIGQSVKVDPRVRAAATAAAAGSSAKAPAIAHIVRGHFRDQACGKERKERKRIYISPFWRGEESGATTERRYEVR